MYIAPPQKNITSLKGHFILGSSSKTFKDLEKLTFYAGDSNSENLEG